MMPAQAALFAPARTYTADPRRWSERCADCGRPLAFGRTWTGRGGCIRGADDRPLWFALCIACDRADADRRQAERARRRCPTCPVVTA